MSIRNKLAIALVAFLAPFVFASTATAQAGAACSGTTCGLGGQIRGQIGDGLALPISIAPAGGGSGSLAVSGPWLGEPHYKHIKTGIATGLGHPNYGGLAFAGKGLGQQGQLKPSANAVINRTTAGGPYTASNPQGLTLAQGAFFYGGQPQGSIGVVNFNIAVFAVQTNLTYDTPHPGTTKLGAVAVTQQNGGPIPTNRINSVDPLSPTANKFFAGGRRGSAVVTYYANATTLGPGAPENNFGGAPATPTAALGEAGAQSVNGIARYTKTKNQFGGQSIGRALGTARVYFNNVPLVPADLPCKVSPAAGETSPVMGLPYIANPQCAFGLSIVDLTGSDATVGVAGGHFGGVGLGSAFMTTKGVFTGTIGFNGTLIGQNNPVTAAGVNVGFTGQGNVGVGMPITTGKLSVTVTKVAGATSEMFIRTGTDARTAGGNGVVALITGSMTQRDISGGNANRTWITLEIPEPSAIFAASAGLFALFGCHRLARRRS
jgi:hypothetical protein